MVLVPEEAKPMAEQIQTQMSQKQPHRRYPQIVGNSFARTRYCLPNPLKWPNYEFYDSTSKRLVKVLNKEKLLALCDGNKQFLLTHEDSTVKILEVLTNELPDGNIHLTVNGYLSIMDIVEKHFSESFVLSLCSKSSTRYAVQSGKFEFTGEDLTTTVTRHRGQGAKVVEILQEKLYIKQDKKGEEPIWSFEDKPLKTITMALLSTVDCSKMNKSSDVGHIGEQVVYHCLTDVFRKNSVKLVSSDKNSSCDIEIEIEEEEEEKEEEEEEEEGKEKKLEEENEKELKEEKGKEKEKICVEVKTTKYTQKKSIILSKREWKCALKQGNSYIIARPVLEATQVKLTLCKNPMKCHRIGFFLERKRKRQP